MKSFGVIFKGISIALFAVFFGGILFRVTHLNSGGMERREVIFLQNGSEEISGNSEFAQAMVYEISNIEGVRSVSFFEVEEEILIGIETESDANSKGEYLKELKEFAKNTVMQYSKVKSEDIDVEINNENSESIAELAYYASKGIDANILNSRFEGICERVKSMRN